MSSLPEQLPTGYPRRLGRYTLVSPLGEGGMATVYVARKDGDPRVCVLKQLHDQFAEHNETNRRFHREAHIASFLSHPGLAQVVDAGVEDGVFCIALEFIAGQTVEQMVKAARSRGGTLPFEVSIHVILEALDALAHAHELTDHRGAALGLVHRDLSPRNVMVGYDGHTKIIDFGIAKGRVDDHRTAAGVLMGTPYYMSPEQARAAEVDHRSDLYTLAAVLFEMLTGQRLVTTKGRAKILMSVVKDPAPLLTVRNPHAPQELEPVLERALRKNPLHRYPSARSFAEHLENAFEAALARTRTVPAHVRLHRVDHHQVGQFLRELLPEGEFKARALLDAVRRLVPAEPASDPTRIASPDVMVNPPVMTLGPAAAAEATDPTRAVTPEELSDFQSASLSEPALEPTMLGLPLSPDQTRAGPGAPWAGDGAPWAGEAFTTTQPSASHPHSALRQRFRWLGALASVATVAAAFALGYAVRVPPPYPATTTRTSSLGSVAQPQSTSERPAEATAISRESSNTEAVPGPSEPLRAEAVRAPPPEAVATPRVERPSRRKGKRRSVRSRPRRSSPPASPVAAQPPPEAPAPNPALREVSRLERRVDRLRSQPDRSAALDLAEAIHGAARDHLEGRSRARVQAEAERVMRTSDVDIMLDALQSAVSALRRSVASGR